MPLTGVTEGEIFAQPHTWAEVLQDLRDRLPIIVDAWQTRPPREVLLTGCGSSYYVASVAASLLQVVLGISCRAAPASEIVFFSSGRDAHARPLLLIAISRSGATTETLWAVERLKREGAATLALTCKEGAPLAGLSDRTLVLPVPERSIVMTGSFTSLLLALALLTARLAGVDDLVENLLNAPALCRRHLSSMSAQTRRVAAARPQHYVYLGSGPLYGIAAEGALKMTEMALLPSYAYHTLEYLHGPRAAVTPDHQVVGLLSERAFAYEQQVLRQIAGLGVDVIAVGGEIAGLESVSFDVAPGSVSALLLTSVWLQLLAFHAAQARGVNPDAPRFLTHVVTWDGPTGQGGEE